jgi:hypothetical protein
MISHLVNPDPLVELCKSPSAARGYRYQDEDLMIQESLFSWKGDTSSPCYSPDNDRDVPRSLVYEPISSQWTTGNILQDQHTTTQ